MAKKLSYKPLDNIGIDGLNTQSNPSTLAPSWLAKAENIVLRESGRISFRKGLKQNVLANTDGVASAPLPIGSLVEHKDGSTTKVFAGVGPTIYAVDFSSPDTPWDTTDGLASAGTASNWQFVNFNKGLYGFQTGNPPIKYTSGSWSITTTKPAGVTIFDPSCGMGYYGRNWVGGISEKKDVMYYTDTLQGDNWTTGAYGSIDLNTVWGNDEIVAIAPFYGKLVIFGKYNIVLYDNPIDPNNMALDEVIRGIGCASRDSVIAVGDDLLFLSDTGLRSLNRTTQLDKVPLQEFSINIKDTLIRNTAQSSNVKSVYVQNEGIYLLSFVDLGINYVFDTKHNTPNGVPRVTTWSFDSNRHPTSVTYTESKGLLVGQKDGSIATYEGYFDKVYVSGGTHTQISYTGTFKTIWINLGDSVVASLLKKLKAVVSGGSGTFIGVKWYKDFSQTPSKTSTLLLNPTTTGTTSLWGSSGASLYGCSTSYDYGLIPAAYEADGITLIAGTNAPVGFCSTGAYNNTNSDMSITNESDCLAVTGNVWNAVTNTTGIDQPTNCATSSAKYTPLFGLKEYNIPLTGSAKHLQIEMSAETNGYVASLQDMTLLFKQGKIR